MKKFLLISSFFLVLISISTIGYSVVSANDTVNELEDIISIQSNKETYLTPYGYTFDNPNVILNPYGISPLTAIILFETEKEESVTITIKGKDKLSTYTNTFEKSTRHYIPVYGLYPNDFNHITLKCGNITKNITIETNPLPIELLTTEEIENNSNKLTFITSDKYPYAIDNNNDIRWYLDKNYTGKIDYLQSGNFLLGDSSANLETYTLYEIDLLGKIHKEYNLDTPYLGTYRETDNSLVIQATNTIEIDKQTGSLLNNKTFKRNYLEETYYHQNLLPLYLNSNNYKLSEYLKFNLTKETKRSDKNIFLIGYVEQNKEYDNYNIELIKTKDNLKLIGEFTKDDEVYLILDKFLDKRIYDVNNNYTIINKIGLSGKYSIYISINGTIYKTNNYIKF